MDLWTFQRFEEPRLCADAIDHEDGSGVVVIRSGTQTYRLAIDSDQAAAQIAADLRTLSDSAAPLWSEVRASTPGSSWHVMGTFLDTHSLIGESKDRARQQLSQQEAMIRQCAEATADAVMKGLSAERRAQAARNAAALRSQLAGAATAAPFSGQAIDPFDSVAQPNFFIALIAMEFEYYRRFSPLTLAAAAVLLGQIAGEDTAHDDTVRALSDSAGLYDERDLASHLWLLGSAIAMSTGEAAARFPTAQLPPAELTSGLEFMRQIELLTRETLDLWGENPYLTAINRLNGEYSPLVAGPFIEQYHVTSRFVEIIAPLLSMRLASPLRSMAFRYYSEEYGHEALESTTCEALGVSRTALSKTLPLPLHFAFVDVLTLLADLDPISSFAAIMVIEGIFGEPPKMSLRLVAAAKKNDAFRNVSGEHDELNETLNHNSISRNMFEQIGAVSPERQTTVARRILFLLELNHRAWGGIADFYGAQDQLWLHGALGERLAPGN